MVGIYKITNILNDKVYIGSSNNITLRWQQHLHKLFRNIHENYKLQKDWIEFGYENFLFSIVEIVENKKDLLKVEQKWIDTILIEENYNILSYSSCEFIDRIKDNYSLQDFEITKEQINLLRKNIRMFKNEKLNSIGSLSKQWFAKSEKEVLVHLKNNIRNFIYNYNKEKEDFYWTTFTSYQKILTSKGTKKKFLSLIDCPTIKCNRLVFACNIYSIPNLKKISKIDDDEFALKVLLRWIINVSDITQDINVYIPSSRMRTLLKIFLESL